MSLESLKKSIIYKAHHRGSKEADLLLGPFSQEALDQLDEKNLQELLRILDQDDGALFDRLRPAFNFQDLSVVEAQLKKYLMEKGWTGHFP